MKRRRRAVITGMGALTGDGVGIDAVWKSFVRQTDAPVQVSLDDFDPRRWLKPKEVTRSARFVHLAVAAADEAIEMAGQPQFNQRRTGVVMATVFAALETMEEQRLRFDAGGPSEVASYYGAAAHESAAAATLSARYGIRGPCKAVIGACAGGGYAIADAVELIRSERCDVVLAGGSQALFTPTLLAGGANLRIRAIDGNCRPFDRRRQGAVFSEGAAVMVIERLEHALDRGARPLAEVLGWGNTNDASDQVRPSGSGAVECIEDALADADLDSAEITSINAHGTATFLNDLVETGAIHTVFGKPGPPVTSIKRVSGHLAGASGALEAVSVVLSIEHASLPPVAIDFEADPEIDLDLVVGRPRLWEPGPTLSNSFGFGGHNCCLVIAPYNP